MFTGPRGSGKSSLLAEIARKADQHRPFAWLDCEPNEDKSVRELLTELAFELNERCVDYGPLAFPRFVIGRMVLVLDLDTTSANAAKEELWDALERHRKVDKLRDFLENATPDLLSSIPTVNQVPGVSTVGRYLPGFVLNRVVSKRGGRYAVLGRAYQWYKHQDCGLVKDPLDVLLHLNRSARSDTMRQDTGQVDETLWAAFLADLREGFGGKHAEKRTSNCAVLLDNIDGKLGKDFLDGLVAARRLHAAHAPDAPDPLSVIGTARGELPGRRTVPSASLGNASHADFESQVADGADDGCYRIDLEDLKQEQVTHMVAGLDVSVAHSRSLGRAVHRFTGGHPGSTRRLLDAVVETGGEVSQLARLLEAQPEHLGGQTVQEHILGELLVDVPDGKYPGAWEALTTCSAARDMDQALQMLVRSPFFTERSTENSGVFKSWFWRDDRTMQPVLRRLLLRRLAARDREVGNNWYYVHSWLRDQYQKSTDDDGVGELYHALALGEVEQVARRMVDQLSAGETKKWYARLRSITAAPNRLTHDRPPIEEFAALNKWSSPAESAVAATGRLIAALWIAGDPLTAPGVLDQRVKTGLNELAPHAEDGMAVLYDETQKWDS